MVSKKVQDGIIGWAFKRIDRCVDGIVKKMKSEDGKRTYFVPACHEEIYYPIRWDRKIHGGKYENFRDVNYLVDSAIKALKNGDAQVFYRIFCLLSDLMREEDGKLGCECFGSGDLKHLTSGVKVENLKRVIETDRNSVKMLRRYGKAMENLMKVPGARFSTGLGSSFSSAPLLGPLIVIAINVSMLWKTKRQLTAPKWLYLEVLYASGWAFFFSFVAPFFGGAAASRVSPIRRAVRKFEYYMLLRSYLSADQIKEGGFTSSRILSERLARFSGDQPREWVYGPTYQKELFGEDFRHHAEYIKKKSHSTKSIEV